MQIPSALKADMIDHEDSFPRERWGSKIFRQQQILLR